MLANFARMIFTCFTSAGWQLSVLPFNRRVVFLPHPINHPVSVAQLKRKKLDIGLLNSGIIYREPTIAAFRLGILNPHIGILPAYRGRNVMEWSVLNGDPVGVTVFFIDGGIDTGERIVIKEQVDISEFPSINRAKQYLFDLDGSFFRKALIKLTAENPSTQINDGSGHRYYVMSKLFQGVVTELLQGNN